MSQLISLLDGHSHEQQCQTESHSNLSTASGPDTLCDLWQLFDRRASGVEALVAAAELPLGELLALAAAAEPDLAAEAITPAAPGAAAEPDLAANPGASWEPCPDALAAADSQPDLAPASQLPDAPLAAPDAVTPAPPAALTPASARTDVDIQPDPDEAAAGPPAREPGAAAVSAPVAAQRTLLLPLAGLGSGSGSRTWHGARLRVRVEYSAVCLDGAADGAAGDAAGGGTGANQGPLSEVSSDGDARQPDGATTSDSGGSFGEPRAGW